MFHSGAAAGNGCDAPTTNSLCWKFSVFATKRSYKCVFVQLAANIKTKNSMYICVQVKLITEKEKQ